VISDETLLEIKKAKKATEVCLDLLCYVLCAHCLQICHIYLQKKKEAESIRGDACNNTQNLHSPPLANFVQFR
jgi:hypothetical protein